MSALPKAILFDLDETIISFGSRRQILQEVIEEFGDVFAPFTPQAAGQAMEDGFRAFWSDEARAAVWRQNLVEGRILAVEQGFSTLRPQAPALTTEFARAFGARFHAYREEQAKFIQQRMENCTRAQTALRTLQSDAQIGHIGPDGQQTAMSTMQREQETRRVRDVIARDCGPLPKETP